MMSLANRYYIFNVIVHGIFVNMMYLNPARTTTFSKNTFICFYVQASTPPTSSVVITIRLF